MVDHVLLEQMGAEKVLGSSSAQNVNLGGLHAGQRGDSCAVADSRSKQLACQVAVAVLGGVIASCMTQPAVIPHPASIRLNRSRATPPAEEP